METRTSQLVTTFATLLLLFVVARSQEQPKAVLVDEFGEFCSEDARSRIDSFFLIISDSPNSTGYIVGLAQTSLPGRYSKFVRLLHNQIAFRRFDPNKVKLLRGPDREDLRIQFWLVPPGSSFSDSLRGYVRSPILVPTSFDASAIESIDKGEVVFGDGDGEPCDFGLRLEDFAQELRQQDNLEAHLVATSDQDHSSRLVQRALRLTQQELTKEYGVRGARIRIVYVGGAKRSEMQLWIVPAGTTRPEAFKSRIRE